MLFNSSVFVWFFTLFFVGFHFVARTRAQRIWLLFLGSVLFYAAWDYRFVPLLVGTAVLDFFIARAIGNEGQTQARRKALLTASIIANLSVLAFFKYVGFFIDSAAGLVHLLGYSWKPPLLGIVLPVGISFYTFQSMSYTIDVYRGELSARQKPVDFLAAVSFFPHLVAGPIVRASTILPQLETFSAFCWPSAQRGLLLIAVGLAKKTVADMLGSTADRVFEAAGPLSLIDAWTGALAFAGQIYGDFSGYTDMAIGVALLLGIELPKNFAQPYVATSPVDFWRRWHISLSSWLRDYLYISLGGNRTHRYRNLMLTMFLGGLWHGANWTFVAWGCYHGGLLVVTHQLGRRFPAILDEHMPGLRRAAQIIITFYLVVIGWVLFRADTFAKAAAVLRGMHAPSIPSITSYSAIALLVWTLMGLIVGHWLTKLSDPASAGTTNRAASAWLWSAACFLFAALVGGKDRAFIYFQF